MRNMFKGDHLRKAKESLSMLGFGNEIMIIYRNPGRLKVFLPPLLYAGSAAPLLTDSLKQIDPGATLEFDDSLATVIIVYDQKAVSETSLFLCIDTIMTPLLAKSDDETVSRTLKQQKKVRLKRVVYHAAVWVTTGYLVYVHLHVVYHWIRRPLRHWAQIGATLFAIWVHKASVDRGLGVPA